MDLSKLSDSDLQAMQAGDMSKMSDEGLQHLSGQAAPSPGPSPTHSGQYRDTVGGAQGGWQALPKPEESTKDVVGRLDQKYNLGVTPQNVEQNLSTLLAPGVSSVGGKGLMGALARTAANAGVGAATDKASPTTGAAIGGLMGGLGEVGGAVAGKAGDWLMQKAVGMKKYLPGVGSTIADNGVWGTKAGMASDVDAALGKHNSALDDAVGRIQGPIDSTKVSSKVGEHISDYKTGDISPAATAPEREAVRSRSNDIANRGDVTPQDALGLKRLAGNEGYNAGRPLANLDSKLAQTESGAYGDELKDAYGRTYPGEENAVASANDNMSALMKAKQGLDTPTTIRAGVPFTTLTGGLIGSALGGGVGTAAGVATAAAARSPLLQSIGAQALTKAAPIAKNATPYMLQALSNKSNPSQ